MSQLSTEDLARALLERLQTGSTIHGSIASNLHTILPLRTTYRRNSTTTAVHDVFNTTELLEEILLHADIKTVLLSQRVSRQVKATVKGSTKLQDNLGFYLHPKPEGSGNSLFHTSAVPVQESLIVINPFLVESTFRSRLGVRDISVDWRRGRETFNLAINIVFDTVEKLQALPKGSWEDLIVVQPSSRTQDRWELPYRFEEGKAFTKSVGTGGWYDALTLGEMVEVFLERWEEMQADPWKSASDYGEKKKD